ncbi:MAG: c-type cytochrome [Sulfuricurvum sp.]|jgi:cytochrome c5|uniref:c-type cytochrome n=1 Tax=Sulfuricurvum sp. TaxID=2025608 RepID=UPI0026305085|nr:cytochrome c [Sulfuricurvum sp.]MDD2839323.1 cytochrome c [Sulfuricurvum sp.]MDD3594785.1 cytochrome c [Sulfuricurvum sp.]MDD4884670.1 cytochrome c [Sulfuricurvum sp.]
MKKSASFFLAAVVAVGMMSTTASADIKKGQKSYLKTCKNCHGNGTKGAAMHTQDEWDDLFANNGAGIIKKHAGTKAEPFFNGDMFKAQSQDLRDFLFEYGSDSGNVPSCG